MILVLSNRKLILKFTEILETLLISQKYSLSNALTIMSKSKRSEKSSKISQTSENILLELQNGNTFANSLAISRTIDFDCEYISFIKIAEKSGNLGETISFLKMKYSRQEENINKIKEAISYPIFVIFLAIAAMIFLFSYSKSIYSEEQIMKLLGGDLISSCAQSFLFLILFIFCGGWFIKKNVGSSKLYEAFLAADFLVKNGESLCTAVEISADILGKNTKEGKMFITAKERMEFGLDLKNSFFMENSGKWDEIQEAFYYADYGEGKTQAFEKIAGKIFLDTERKRNRCLKLIEPICISGTAVFLIFFLMNTALPLLQGNLLETF